MKKLTFLDDIEENISSFLCNVNSSDNQSSKLLDLEQLNASLFSLRTELAGLESTVTSATCTEFGEHEVDYQSLDFSQESSSQRGV